MYELVLLIIKKCYGQNLLKVVNGVKIKYLLNNECFVELLDCF